jgi:hypothetical protein
MIRIFNKAPLFLAGLLMTIAIFTACEKDDNVNSSTTQLLSFGPTGAKIGDTLSFIGTNLNVVTEIDFTGNAAVVPQSAFISQSAELIKVVVPTSAEQGFVTLKTPQGNIVTKTKLNLNVASMITTITKTARPGDNITITGNYLNWVTRVSFAKDKNVDSFVSKTINQIVVKVPMDAQTGPLVISYGGTKPLQVETADTLRVTLPAVAALAPNPVKHATNLTITGTNLDLVKSVMFAGVATPVTAFVSQSAVQIVVAVPGATTKGKVTLAAFSGVTTQSTADLDVVLPAITSISPTAVDTGANLTINGTNLDLVTAIKFSGVQSPVTTFVSKTATRIVVKVPAGILKGKLVLSVLNTSLTVESTDEISWVNAPTVTPFKTVIYDDAINSTWQKWDGWGTTAQDLGNTEQPQTGSKAFKIVYSDAYGGVQFHPASSFPLGSYTAVRLSIYGGANTTADSKVAIYIKSAAGVQGADKILALKPGVYTTFEIPLSQLGNPTDISELVMKNQGTANMTIYVDNYGLY